MLEKFYQFKNLVENLYKLKISCLRIDGGGEYVSKELSNYLIRCGIRR